VKISKKRIFINIALIIVAALFILIGYSDTKSSSVVPILMYHSFQVEKSGSTPYVKPEIFHDQMEFFIKNGYNIIGPDKVIAYMTKEEKMPAKTVLITIDDGLHSFYENGYPILKKYHIQATLFMITDRIDQPGYIGWKELREMSDSGLITIASHTTSHPWLPTISVDEEKLRNELVASKEALEKGIGKKVDYICYPNGGFNDTVKEAAKRYGYKGAFTTNPSKKSAINDIYAIRRLKMSSTSNSPIILFGKVSRYYAWFKERR